MMKIRYARPEDLSLVREIDPAVTTAELTRWAENAQVLLIYEQDDFAGWLQYSLFQEKIPFINRFEIKEQFRGLGDGKLTLLIWQRQMEERFYDKVMTACRSDNTHFRTLLEHTGYRQIGTLQADDGTDEAVYMKILPKPDI